MRRGLLVLVLALAALPGTAFALIGETPTIRAVAVARNPVVTELEELALIELNADGTYALNVRQIGRATGIITGAGIAAPFPAGVTPVDVVFSTTFKPGSLLVLTDELWVLEWPLAFDADGRVKFIEQEPIVHGPFGDPLSLGGGTALAEAPNVSDPTQPFLAIGTMRGVSIITAPGPGVMEHVFLDLGEGAVTGLATVPQVGSFAFVAAQGGLAVGILPDKYGAEPGLQPDVIFQLADPRPHPFIDLSTAVFEPNDEPLSEPQPVRFVAANGTTQVTVFEIPADAGSASDLTLNGNDALETPIGQVAVGSLVTLAADGSAVLYDPAFTIAGGFGATTFTVFGASLRIAPETVNLRSRGQWVTAVIEVENGGAAEIEPSSLTLTAGSASVSASTAFPPQLGDADGDGNADLLARFGRSAVNSMLDGALAPELTQGAVMVGATWAFSDGSTGSASAQVRARR